MKSLPCLAPFRYRILLGLSLLSAPGCQGASNTRDNAADGTNAPLPGSPMDPDSPGALRLHGCFQSDYAALGKVGKTDAVSLLVDSGSMALAIASTKCVNCKDLSPLYDPTGPEATALNYPPITAAYGDGDVSTVTGWKGSLYKDRVGLGTTGDTNMALAAISKQSEDSAGNPTMFVDSTCTGIAAHDTQQGIIGLAPSNLGPANADAFINKWSASTGNPNLFAVQLCDSGGRLWLGNYDANFMVTPPTYTPMRFTQMPNPGYYLVTVNSISIAGTPLNVSASNYGNALADTGTSVMTVTNAVLAEMTHTLESNAKFVARFGSSFMGTTNCASVPGVSRADLDAELPPMRISFPGMAAGTTLNLDLPATSSYLIPAVDGGGTTLYCAAIQAGTAAGSQNINMILGNSLMHQHVVVFDQDNQQLGWAPQTRCTKTFK